eukprot:2017206-Pyramimonas_sp.AAC.1
MALVQVGAVRICTPQAGGLHVLPNHCRMLCGLHRRRGHIHVRNGIGGVRCVIVTQGNFGY